ncbi:hypothetical protein BD408DRAFT_431355 [Parasitella parasitica]|nr:hypothetical protein BD408DRAFT_431355 [Parasitella parasitica]
MQANEDLHYSPQLQIVEYQQRSFEHQSEKIGETSVPQSFRPSLFTKTINTNTLGTISLVLFAFNDLILVSIAPMMALTTSPFFTRFLKNSSTTCSNVIGINLSKERYRGFHRQISEVWEQLIYKDHARIQQDYWVL